MNELEVRPSREGDIDQIRQIYAEPTNYAATFAIAVSVPRPLGEETLDAPGGIVQLGCLPR